MARDNMRRPFVKELAFAAALTVVSVAAYAVLRHVGRTEPVLRVTLAFSLCATWALVCIAAPRWHARRYLGRLALGTSAVWLVALLLVFDATRYGMGGYKLGDSTFLSAMVTKARWYATAADFTYRGLSAFYPPLFGELLGKLARETGIEPQQMRKLGSIAMVCALVPLTFFAWRKQIGARAALFCALMTVLPSTTQGLFKPYELAASCLFAPFWLSLVGDRFKSRRRRLLGAVCGALLLTTYYYPFFAGAFDLVRRAILASWQEKKPRLGVPASALVVLGGALFLASWFWLPLVRDALHFSFHGLQQRWFKASHVGVLLLDESMSIQRLAVWAGLACLVFDVPRRPATTALRGLAFSSVTWVVFSFFLSVFDQPLLGARMLPAVHAILLAGAAQGLDRGLLRLAPQFGRFGTRFILVLTSVACLPALTGITSDKGYRAARKAGSSRPFEKLQTRDYFRKVVLTTDPAISVESPLFSFIAWNAHYSHPAARFEERLAFLRKLVNADEKTLCARLKKNPFDAVDYVYVNASRFVITTDAFPKGNKPRSVPIPRALRTARCLVAAHKVNGGTLYRVR